MNATREIPAGKVLLHDNPPREELATRTVLDVRTGCKFGRTYELVAISPGYVTAGSTMRWQNGSYAALYEQGGAIHGAHFTTEAEARERFERFAK